MCCQQETEQISIKSKSNDIYLGGGNHYYRLIKLLCCDKTNERKINKTDSMRNGEGKLILDGEGSNSRGEERKMRHGNPPFNSVTYLCRTGETVN